MANANAPIEWERLAFPYDVSNMMIRSKTVISILLLFRKTHVRENYSIDQLFNAIEDTDEPVTIVVDLHGNIKNDIRRDVDCRNELIVFQQQIIPPLHLSVNDFWTWRARLILPLVILSAARFRWGRVLIQSAFLHGRRSYVSKTLSEYWISVAAAVTQDIQEAVRHSNIFFCNVCNPACPLFGCPFHLQLNTFTSVRFVRNCIPTGVYTRICVFGSGRPLRPTILTSLQDLYEENDDFEETSVDRALGYIDLVAQGPLLPHCCYTLLIFQGLDLETHNEQTVLELSVNNSLKKLIYVGVTKGDNYRVAHLTDGTSAVYKVLSHKARMYVIRRYVTDSRRDAMRDEAFVIDLLKSCIARKVEARLPLPFLLLNNYSGPLALLGVTSDFERAIHTFATLDPPIVTANSTRPVLTQLSEFTGNYSLSTPIPLPSFVNTPFADVENEIDRVTKRNNSSVWTTCRALRH